MTPMMPTQIEPSDQSQAMETFAVAAREAKLAEESSADQRGRTAEALMAAGCELLAVEDNLHHGKELSPHLKIHFDRVSAHLAGHIDPGPAMTDKRRAVLARALPLVAEQRQGDTSDPQLAAKLNTPSRGRPLQLLKNDDTRPAEMRFSGVLKREFNGADARNLVAALSDLQTSLNVHSRRMESVFDLDHAHRDVPQPLRSPSFIAATPDRERIWASPVYGEDRESTSPGSSPPTSGRKRERPYDSDTSLPPPRRARIGSPDFNIHEDRDIPPARGAARNDEWPSRRQRSESFAIYEDAPHSSPGALQPVTATVPLTADSDKENVPPQHENVRARSRDRDSGR
jgi:hypothetical protein